MRDVLHIGCLFLVFAFLVTRYPSEMPSVADSARAYPSFAAFVELSPSAHAARLAAARTSWQVRSQARIGQLDSDVPLLSETLPPPVVPEVHPFAGNGAELVAPDANTYSFLPPTAGAEMPDFAIKGLQRPAGGALELQDRRAFGKDQMLAIEDYETLKEIMR